MKKMRKKVMALALSVILAAAAMIPAGLRMVDAKAASTVLCPDNDTYSATSIATSGDSLELGNGFTLKGKSGSFVKSSALTFEDGNAYTKYIDLLGKAVLYSSSGTASEYGYIKFTVSAPSTIKVYWTTSGTSYSLGVFDYTDCTTNHSNTPLESYTVSAAKEAKISTYDVTTAGDYAVGGIGGKVYIYRIEVTAASASTSYSITVKDEKATETSVTASYAEGAELTLEAADPENFLYWMNSNERVVSRNATATFPVYYADTYKAVYKSATATVNYMTAFGQKYKSIPATDLAAEPTGPVRYGYEFDKWSKTLEEIQAEVEAGATDVEVTPVYKEITETFDITVDNGTQTTDTYKKNEVVEANASELANFSYWKDENDTVLSYNPVYYFFASKTTTVTAVTGETVEATGVIENVDYVEADTNKTFVFVFTVPDGCTIEFAGIAASSTVSDPTLTSEDTLVRGKASASTTVRLTWTKTNASGTTWNVKPILKYKTSEGTVKTIEGTVVSR